jgi:uncharacterized DUF497 family protein
VIKWDKEKNKKLIRERKISFEEVADIILEKKYLDILENPARENQKIFIIKMQNYTYVVPVIIDSNDNIILKTIFPSRKFHKIYGGTDER